MVHTRVDVNVYVHVKINKLSLILEHKLDLKETHRFDELIYIIQDYFYFFSQNFYLNIVMKVKSLRFNPGRYFS